MSRKPVLPPTPKALESVAFECQRALARVTGCGQVWTDLQRRALAAVVLVEKCTLEQAEAALTMAEAELVASGYSFPWHDDMLTYNVQKACDQITRQRNQQKPQLRVLQGGAS